MEGADGARHDYKTEFSLEDVPVFIPSQVPDFAENKDAYHYQTLRDSSSIRLFTIAAGAEAAHISVSLCEYSVQSRPEYICLSYAWGNTELNRVIECDGCCMRVTAALHSALARLRLQFVDDDTALLMWVDAISINQAPSELATRERNHQVSLMAAIFENAQRVFVDLGEASDGTTGALQKVCALDAVQQYTARSTASGSHSIRIEPEYQFELDLEWLRNCDTHEFGALLDIYQRPVFHRLWCFQEFILARSLALMVGERMVDSQSFSAITEAIYRITGKALEQVPPTSGLFFTAIAARSFLSAPSDYGVLAMTRMRERVQESLLSGSRVSLTFLEIWERSNTRHVTDPRDRIYAVQALCSDGTQNLEVDYHENAANLSLRISRSMVQNGEGLTLLRNPRGITESGSSWSFNLSRLVRQMDILQPQQYVPICTASFEGHLSDSMESFVVSGKFLGVINSIFPINDRHLMGDGGILHGYLWLDVNLHPVWPRSELHAVQTGDFRIRGNEAKRFEYNSTTKGLLDGPDGQYCRQLVEDLQPLLTEIRLSTSGTISRAMNDSKVNVSAHVLEWHALAAMNSETHSPSIITMENSTHGVVPGLVPHAAQIGDVLVYIYGHTLPFVLRPRLQTTGYLLVGSAYVHKYMGGEGLHEDEQRQWFELY